MTWEKLNARLAGVPGTVSVYAGGLNRPPAYTRLPHATHYAASTMKVAILVALYRAAEAGRLNLDRPVPVRNEFDSALPEAPRFSCAQHYDNDDAVWDRLGRDAPLRWLADRMIIRSSNLATNLVLAHVGLPAVAEVWSLAGARHSITSRGIEDFAAREAGLTNLVTAADLAALFNALTHNATASGPLAAPATCAAMLDVLFAQQHREDLAAGLPEGTRIAHKNGWVRGVRHCAGAVFPPDAPPYVISVCTSTALADGRPTGNEIRGGACRLIAHISATVWGARKDLTAR